MAQHPSINQSAIYKLSNINPTARIGH